MARRLVAGVGGRVADGIDQPIHFSHDLRCVSDRADQPDRVIWVTQALRDFDIMTSQGQTVLVFIGITGLIIPLLVLVIAPIALLIAVAHMLNKLCTDSEIIVMNAAGISPGELFRAFLNVAIVVSLMVTVVSAYFAPQGPAHAARLAHRSPHQRRRERPAARAFHDPRAMA